MSWSDAAAWVAAFAAVIGTAIAVSTLRSSMKALTASFEESRYAQLDNLYLELQKMRIERPELAGRRPVDAPPEGAVAWDNYACMVWCFIESVVDYCETPGRNIRAWLPAVAYESVKYREFWTEENVARFHPGFQTRVANAISGIQT
jgi:hypothetical protein